MTKQEVLDYISAQLQVPVTQVQKLHNSFSKVLDFVTESSVDDVIPDWNANLTFNTDGSGAGRYCTHPDLEGKKRIFETKIDDNTGNEPPTDPNVTENTAWVEISQSAGSGIREYAPGLFGAGLVINFHNHSTDGPGLYILNEPERPFNSTDIEAEITQGRWQKLNTSSQNVEEVSVVGGVLTLDMQNYRDKYFRLLPAGGADADFTIAFTNAPPNGSYIMLEIVRSTNVNRFITFPVGANMVNSDQNLDNGGSSMEIGGTDAPAGKRRYHYIGILFTKPEGSQKYIVNMQSSRSFVP